jgi:ectoine hydroxylase-related dioxygenase (phytanoyl-CoA dioxygenase family)
MGEYSTGSERAAVPSRLFSLEAPPRLVDSRRLISQTTNKKDYPQASTVSKNIPVYDLSRCDANDASQTGTLQDEWYHILLSGPGVFVLQNFLSVDAIERAKDVDTSIAESERARNSTRGDHFAPAGSNTRVWNSYQKHALISPSTFVEYYSNPWLSLVSEAWLGPGYQITAQLNIVHPGGAPQTAHRDYHIGFQSPETSARYPRAVHVASQHLTLQGGVAHSDMPLESGPTRFLPFSQMFAEGFMAYRLPEFQDHFEQNWVSLPMKMGDAVFFNPVLFHAAGRNDSTQDRSANLLQVSSAFGRTMETIDTLKIIEQTWPALAKYFKDEGALTLKVKCAIQAIGGGYPFPTNLDRRQPQHNGMAPESEQDVLIRALEEDWDYERVIATIKQIREDSLS